MFFVLLWEDDGKSHAHVEGLVHFVGIYIAIFLEEGKNWLGFNWVGEVIFDVFVESWEVSESSAGDVCEAVYWEFVEEMEYFFDVYCSGCEKYVSDCLVGVDVVGEWFGVGEVVGVYDFSDE